MKTTREVTIDDMPLGLKVSFEKPPVYDNVCAAFGIIPRNTFFTYGDTVYNPDRIMMPLDIVEHEKVHMEQQDHSEAGAEIWWGKYLRDPVFRIDQEGRAYGIQYKFVCSIIKDREQRNRALMRMVGSLSGPLYQNAIGQAEAIEMIKYYAK